MVKPILVLCIDRDNDLYEKTKIHGASDRGGEENLKAATKLALADPGRAGCKHDFLCNKKCTTTSVKTKRMWK